MGRGCVIRRPCMALWHIVRNEALIFFSSANQQVSHKELAAAAASSSSLLVPWRRPPPLLFDSSTNTNSNSNTNCCNYQLSLSRNFNFNFTLSRNICSASSGPSNIVMIKSEEEFNSSLRKVQDESFPAIFYFTAAWCGPCRLLSPIIGQLSEEYPHVTTYKVDIDQEGLEKALSELNIHSVPTLHFYQNGKKASEVIGADVQRLMATMEKLYS